MKFRIDKHKSKYQAQLEIPVDAFELEDQFWLPRLGLLIERSLPAQHNELDRTGRLDNFRRATGQYAGQHQGYVYNDSDVYKWVEAASWALALDGSVVLEDLLQQVVTLIVAAQDEDGYLNTAFLAPNECQRWQNLRDNHELYCAGHMIQAGIAHQTVTGRLELLTAAIQFADHICDRFGLEKDGKIAGVPGHQEIEIALIELFRITGQERYLTQAIYFLNARGHGLIGGLPYHQDHLPFRGLKKLEGHAVRAVYQALSAAEVYAEIGDTELILSLEMLWNHLYSKRIYLTGGIGSRHSGESIGADYELPNATAYCETCASVALVMWNWRMLTLTGESRFGDAIETTLYNALLAGISLCGTQYFYTNPLADEGPHRRQPWFECACCPPNLARLLASLPKYFFTVDPKGVSVHLFATGKIRLPWKPGSGAQSEEAEIALTIETEYPWSGEVRIRVETSTEFELRFRRPGWVGDNLDISLNGAQTNANLIGGYYTIDRRWGAGDEVLIKWAMPVRIIRSHPAVITNLGRAAVIRGPVVYCIEAKEPHPDQIILDTSKPIIPVYPKTRPGVILIPKLAGSFLWPDKGDLEEKELYTQVPAERGVKVINTFRTISHTLLPYFVWGNGDPLPMRVWLRARLA